MLHAPIFVPTNRAILVNMPADELHLFSDVNGQAARSQGASCSGDLDLQIDAPLDAPLDHRVFGQSKFDLQPHTEHGPPSDHHPHSSTLSLFVSKMVNHTRSGSPHSEVDEEDLFAQMEAEIENDDDAAVRERGMQQFRQE